MTQVLESNRFPFSILFRAYNVLPRINAMLILTMVITETIRDIDDGGRLFMQLPNEKIFNDREFCFFQWEVCFAF